MTHESRMKKKEERREKLVTTLSALVLPLNVNVRDYINLWFWCRRRHCRHRIACAQSSSSLPSMTMSSALRAIVFILLLAKTSQNNDNKNWKERDEETMARIRAKGKRPANIWSTRFLYGVAMAVVVVRPPRSLLSSSVLLLLTGGFASILGKWRQRECANRTGTSIVDTRQQSRHFDDSYFMLTCLIVCSVDPPADLSPVWMAFRYIYLEKCSIRRWPFLCDCERASGVSNCFFSAALSFVGDGDIFWHMLLSISDDVRANDARAKLKTDAETKQLN